MAEDKTTVTVTDDTWRRLMMRKGRGDSFDDVIGELLDLAEEHEEEQDES
ncbi:antitoxin VapB family protein [Natronomonas gomsonensis]|nr:antitoxin VapB family protein [Natronomonas gomsonensis]